MTLIELAVAGTLMLMMFSIFTSGLVTAFTGARTVRASVTSQGESNTAFLQLGRQVRSASAVTAPGQVGGMTYVELLTTASGVPTCTQLRVAGSPATLAQRSWALSAGAANSPWEVVANNVVAGATPFTVTSASGTTSASTLTISLKTVGDSASSKTRDLTATFVLRGSALIGGDASACATRPDGS